MALGARPSQVLGMIMSQGISLGAVGIVIGLAASVVVLRALSGLLFGITPLDPITLIGVSAIVLAICALASYVPARRAICVDPVEVLKRG